MRKIANFWIEWRKEEFAMEQSDRSSVVQLQYMPKSQMLATRDQYGFVRFYDISMRKEIAS